MYGNSYTDQIDPRRRMPGSGMPPSSAPNIMTQVGRGSHVVGQAPQPMPRTQAPPLDPQVMKMLMEMLQRSAQGRGRGQPQGQEQPLLNQTGQASMLHEQAHCGLCDLSPQKNHGMLSGILESGTSSSQRQGEAYGPYYPYYPPGPDAARRPLAPPQFIEPQQPVPEIYDIAGPIRWA